MIDKIDEFIRNSENIIDTKTVLNPELLDTYFYAEKRDQHHMCFIREYMNDDDLYNSVITKFETFPEILKDKERNEHCNNCSLDCVNKIHPTFNFASYFIIVNIQLRGDSVHKTDKESLVINCLNLLTIKGEDLVFDFERMTAYFTDYDLRKINHVLSQNSNLKNLSYLNKVNDIINTIDNKISIFSNEETKPCVIKKSISDKEEYFNKQIIIDEKLEKEGQKEFSNDSKNSEDKKLKLLKDLWLPTAKISIQDLLEIGVENKIWDENNTIITKRGSLYGNGKILLGSLSVALKNFAYSDTFDYKILGKAFCNAFNITINNDTKQPYKSFSNSNPNYTREFKRLLRIR